ncbi:hypothetical protein AB4K20DRAFT_1863819 [Rhizopus microsporus]
MAEIALKKSLIKNSTRRTRGFLILWIVENIYPEKQTKKLQPKYAVCTRIIALSIDVQALRAEIKTTPRRTSGNDHINKDTQADASPANSSSTIPSYRISVNHNSQHIIHVHPLPFLYETVDQFY